MQAPSEVRHNAYYRGVYACGKRWKAQIHYNGCQHYLGTFDSPEEAARAYDRAARLHHGFRARVNFGGDIESASPSTSAQSKETDHTIDTDATYSEQARVGRSVLLLHPLAAELTCDHGGQTPSAPTSEGVQREYQQFLGDLLCDPNRRVQYAATLKRRICDLQTVFASADLENDGIALMDEFITLSIRLDDITERASDSTLSPHFLPPGLAEHPHALLPHFMGLHG